MRRYPTTLDELLEDRTYRLYFRDVKEPALRNGYFPWMVMAEKPTGKFARGLRATFPEAAALYDEIMDSGNFRDASIVSRGMVYPWPHETVYDGRDKLYVPKFDWADDQTSWCGRCRRTTVYRMCADGHPAINMLGVPIQPNVRRCHFCGLQKGFNNTWTRS